jgi:hypothetical protein
VNVLNKSASAGTLVSGTHQQVDNIVGSGSTRINAGNDLTTDQIIQTALVIGGTSKNLDLVTITALDASGNPLIASHASLLSDGPRADRSRGERGCSWDPVPCNPARNAGFHRR